MHFESIFHFGWTMVMIAITFLVLYLILKKYFFEKVRAFMLARETKVKEAFENADAANRSADERLVEYEKKLSGAETERREILMEAKITADENARAIVKAAEERISAMMIKAEKEIEREKQQAIESMREQIALLAVYAAEKILERNIDANDQAGIIDGVIREAERSEWKI
jgi:F-type H+-transporting ATPase subunit b